MSTCSGILVGKVRDYLHCKYQIDYKGKFTYTFNRDTDEYRLMWDLNDQDHPMIMQGNFLNEDQFYAYVCKEIDRKKPFMVQYFIARKVQIEKDKDGNVKLLR